MKRGYLLGRRWKRLRRLMTARRDVRRELLERMPKHAVCAEIGVWRGEFSARILAVTAPRELHLIDPWAFLPEFSERGYGGAVAQGQSDMERMYEGVKRKLGSRPDVVVHRAFSKAALESFPDAAFDWVYIDANHYYSYVREDLELSLRKVKPGGLIAGDDFDWGEKDGFPVKRAVTDFIAAHALAANCELLGSQFVIRTPPRA